MRILDGEGTFIIGAAKGRNALETDLSIAVMGLVQVM